MYLIYFRARGHWIYGFIDADAVTGVRFGYTRGARHCGAVHFPVCSHFEGLEFHQNGTFCNEMVSQPFVLVFPWLTEDRVEKYSQKVQNKLAV